ncbi:Neural cell adhesion molecule L1, partial [Dissostichus eleginoides]
MIHSAAVGIQKEKKRHEQMNCRVSEPPELTKLPHSYTAFSHEDINLPCEATGNPTPTFRWVKDGEAFGSEREEFGTLRAQDEEETLDSYGGYYRSQPVLLKQQRVDKKANEGDSMILACNPPNSSTPPHIHWMDRRMVHIKLNDRVMVGLDGNLYFSNLIKTDSRRDYFCNAQYTAARTVLPLPAVHLTVMQSNDLVHSKKPDFFHPVGSHSSVQALRGHSVVLECLPKGLPTPKIEWKKKDGSLEETSGRVDSDSHGRWFRFDSIEQNDDGEYECIASNNHGSVSHSFTLTVEAPPYWVKESQSLRYAPGETVRLECQAEGIPTPKISWSINGELLSDVDDDPRRSVSGGVMILRDVVFADTAVYQCVASNEHGSILLNIYLYVVELPPQILTSDAKVYKFTEGGSVVMDCESFGSPRPHITWEGEDRLPLLSDPRVALLTNGSIIVSDVSHEDSGEYSCSIKHSNISISAHLEVYNQTVILNGPQDVRVLRGSSALLDCVFQKDPRLIKYQIVWKKAEHKMQESSPDDKHTIFDNGTLKVTNIQSDDSAPYSCEVITALGSVTASGSITVVARPDPPEGLSLSDVADHSLTLSWNQGKTHNSPIIEFIVEAREEQHTEDGRWRWEEWKRVPGEFNHLELTLHPYCTYRFRVFAINEIGRSEPSHFSDHHKTPPAVPDRNPSGVRSESTDPKTMIITWDEMDKRFHSGEGFKYHVSWRAVSDAQWNHADVLTPPYVINDTGTYTPFEIKVQAVNDVGGAPTPEPEIGYSGEDEPQEAPTNVSTKVIDSTVIVKWKEAQNVRGLLLGYKIYLQRLGPQGGRVRRSLGKQHQEREDKLERVRERDRQVAVHGMKTSEEVTGLRLYSRYELSVAAFNSKGEGPRSPPHHFSTPQGVTLLESPSEKSMILYWSPPEETNGILKGYVVQYREDLENSLLEMEYIDDPTATHFELDSLDPRSHYIFNLIASTVLEGPPITRRGATALDGVAPSHINIVPSNTSLNLSWVHGERFRNHGFIIRYRRKSPGCVWLDSEVVNSTQGSYSLKGLLPGSEYHLKINDTHTYAHTPSVIPGGFAARGWLIGLIAAILLLVLILLILCLIKRSRGGKYAVKDKEDKEGDSEARPMKDNTFGEYRSLESDADEKRSESQPSLCGESKLGSDDSLAEYGDSVDIQFNEDGSFIGQYSNRGPAPPGHESSGPPLRTTASRLPPSLRPCPPSSTDLEDERSDDYARQDGAAGGRDEGAPLPASARVGEKDCVRMRDAMTQT